MCTPLSLTTVFSAPTSCAERLFSLEGGDLAIRQYTDQYSACYPTSVAAINLAYGYSNSVNLCSGAYLPGVCPENWKVAYTSYGDYSFSLPGVEPTSFCCPNSMTFDSDADGCQTIISTPAAMLTSPAGGSLQTTTVTSTLTLIDFFIPVGGNMQAIVGHTSSSLKTSSTSSTSRSTTTVATGNRRASSLSDGAIAGIATSITIVAIATIAGIAIFILRKGRQKQRSQILDGAFLGSRSEKRGISQNQPSAELDANVRSELSATEARSELPDSNVGALQELEGSSTQPAELAHSKSTK